MAFYRAVSDGLMLSVRATPKASKDSIDGLMASPEGQALKIKTTAPPDKGKANAAICALLAKAFGVPKSAVSIHAGDTARRKVVHITGETKTLATIAATWTTK